MTSATTPNIRATKLQGCFAKELCAQDLINYCNPVNKGTPKVIRVVTAHRWDGKRRDFIEYWLNSSFDIISNSQDKV